MQLTRETLVRRFAVYLATATLAVAGVTVQAAPAQAAGTCDHFAAIDRGKYWINNNVWGRDSGSGWQCIWDNWQSGNDIGWGTSYGWSGTSYTVKSYSAAILGWHWGWRRSGTGLPVQLSANRSVNTGWNYSVRHSGGAMNVAYDLWLHSMSNPSYNNNPTDEVMIWPYRLNGAGPAGTRQATVNLAGANWDLYRGWIDAGNGNGWNVFSFVRTSNTTSVTLNLRDFLNDLRSRGWVGGSKYLTSVQAGAEVFTGNGQVDTNSYYANVS